MDLFPQMSAQGKCETNMYTHLPQAELKFLEVIVTGVVKHTRNHSNDNEFAKSVRL